jgi:glucokinase
VEVIMDSWVAGVDLGGTKIEVGLLDPQDRILARRRIPTRAEEGPESAIERIAQTVAELEAGISYGGQVIGLGICCPGPLDHQSGVIINATNLPKFNHAPLRKMLVDRMKIPVFMEHDAKAAALGEYHFGAGRGERSMVYTVVGTGVGSALILDGQLYRGLRNYAGEGGHTTIDREGEPCACGSRGCVETYTSGPWLARRYKRALEAGEEPGAAELPAGMTGEMVARLAGHGDPLAGRIMEQAGEALGLMVATMAMVLDVELFVFGGSVSKSGELLLEPARRAVPKYSFHSVSSRVRIVNSHVGDDGPILGCGWLARQFVGTK